MDALSQQLLQQLTKGGLSQISQQIGADENTTGSALSAALPMLVSALARNASNQNGAQALHQALSKDHDGSILDNLSGFLTDSTSANGAGILGHILGGQQSVVTQGLAKGTGLQGGQIGKLLQIAAPLVMGMLGKQLLQKGLNTGSLSDYLGGQRQQAQQANPNMMSTLNNLLDMDKDGSAVDDVLGMVGKLFK